MKVALVLGGTGVVGSATCGRLRRDGWKVMATGRAGGEPLEVGAPDGHEAFLERVAALRPDVVMDAIGRFAPTPLSAPAAEIRSLWDANAFGRAALLQRIVPLLPAAATVIRVESSLGDFPLLSAPVVSAAKAADRVLGLVLLRACRAAGIGFGAVVVTAVAESLAPDEVDLFTRRFGHVPPTATALADTIVDLVPIARRSPAGVRLLFPAHGFAVDPMSGASGEE